MTNNSNESGLNQCSEYHHTCLDVNVEDTVEYHCTAHVKK